MGLDNAARGAIQGLTAVVTELLAHLRDRELIDLSELRKRLQECIDHPEKLSPEALDVLATYVERIGSDSLKPRLTVVSGGKGDGPTPQELGRRLYRLMIEHRWNQSELARVSGIHRDTISAYVNGRSLPDTAALAS